MKRQRNTKNVAAGTTNDDDDDMNVVAKVEGTQVQERDQDSTTKRKARKQAEVVVVVEEEEEIVGGLAATVAGMEEYWPWMRGMVDEQMSWGYISLPDWDLDKLKGKAHSNIYNDDCWDDDLWGLKAIKEIPK